ncbi:MAG: sigma-70 family RNA polymerase sigma factor [Labilithrix sp.]|nr:sigma-70 family RNA polymerase sigma factor [Labilithrix sp.]
MTTPRSLPTLDEAEETALVERARTAEAARDEAFAEIFRIYRLPVLKLCVHVIGDASEAEDVVQQVFLSVHRALPLFRGDSRLSTWIYRIALRAAIAARSKRRTFEPLAEHLRAPSTEDEIQLRDEARRAAAAMDRLSIEHRAVLSLFAIDGLSHREIANVLGVPEGTVWSRLSAARRRLNDELRGG